jgi:hypothetical protein
MLGAPCRQPPGILRPLDGTLGLRIPLATVRGVGSCRPLGAYGEMRARLAPGKLDFPMHPGEIPHDIRRMEGDLLSEGAARPEHSRHAARVSPRGAPDLLHVLFQFRNVLFMSLRQHAFVAQALI